MEVIIDGKKYIPQPPIVKDKNLLNVLELRFNSDAGKNLTIREYLYKLLATLWVEQEGFSGKRPFGNSGWEDDIYKVLIKNKILKGKLDSDEYVDEIDTKIASVYVLNLIRAAFFGVNLSVKK